MEAPLSPETLAAQAMGAVDSETGALVPPLHPATTYEMHPDGSLRDGRAYTRADNPTYDPAEQLLNVLEGGAGCILFASGNAAATAVFQALLPGDHVLVSRILYWGIRKWLAEFAVPWGLDVEFVDVTDLEALGCAIRPGATRLLWLETPANPTWEITDIAAAVEIAHAAQVCVAVDNTVPTPVLTRPIELGADVVVHSATKYLNGHSDVLAGAVVTARLDPFWERIRSWRRNAGAMLGPFEAWLLQRGMRTLFVRVRRASETALTLAQQLQGHPALKAVLYPGLPSHPGHEAAARQMGGGFGGMLSIRVAGGEEQALAVAAAARVFKRATSLGGVESLIEHRLSTEGPSSPVPGDLLRLSVGLETPEDLLADLTAALDASRRVRAASVAKPAPTEEAPEVVTKVRDVVERSVAPLIIARGGKVRLVSVDDGIVTLEASGSPGAILPVEKHLKTLLCGTVAEVTDVRLVWPGNKGSAWPDTHSAALSESVQTILDTEINPAVAVHGGRVTLIEARADRVTIRLEDGCQGCNLAIVTVRQGIEPLLRARLGRPVAVIDATDHAAGTAPFFTPSKR
jgi:cystathionine gamma-synthase